ncbi:type III pantothenate kinase [Candidatus Latescibacterota bacterium]
MIALFDSGSTHLHFGLWDNGRLIRIDHLPYPPGPASLEAVITVLVDDFVLSGAAACSVSNTWREALFRVVEGIVPGKLRVARTAADIGVALPYTASETYGVDRALAVRAAHRRFEASCVVADAGTALTVDAVNDDGSVAGGFIIPGFHLQASALRTSTDLPTVTPDGDDAELGRSTEDSIRLGISYGFHAAAKDLIKRAAIAVQAGDRIILTGGDADEIASLFPEPIVVTPGLVLEGLGLVMENLPCFA